MAVWSGWVGLGGMCGFGVVHPLPGIVSGLQLDTAITLPVGVEAYGAYALGAWLTPGTPERARTFARRSAIGALALGMLGQVVYHLLAAAGAQPGRRGRSSCSCPACRWPRSDSAPRSRTCCGPTRCNPACKTRTRGASIAHRECTHPRPYPLYPACT